MVKILSKKIKFESYQDKGEKRVTQLNKKNNS